MPQELQVLRCHSCETFQVHIVKKSPKWECKICGEKQPINKVYGRGPGKDCRLLVQELNQKHLESNQELPVNEAGGENHSDSEGRLKAYTNVFSMDIKPNRWAECMPSAATVTSNRQYESDELFNYTFQRPVKRCKLPLSTKTYLKTDQELRVNETNDGDSASDFLSAENRWAKCVTDIVKRENTKFLNQVFPTSAKKYVHSDLNQKSIAFHQELDLKELLTENSPSGFTDAVNLASSAEAKTSRWAQFISTSSTTLTAENETREYQHLEDLNITKLDRILNHSQKRRSSGLCLKSSTSKWDEFGSDKNLLEQNEILASVSSKHFETTSSNGRLKSEKGLNLYHTAETDLDSILTF